MTCHCSLAELKQITWLSTVGLVMVIFGDCLRKAAMLTAGSNFNHIVQNEKSDTHTLVTTGVYGWFRHPSYVGWFYWSIGTQVPYTMRSNTFVIYPGSFSMLPTHLSQDANQGPGQKGSQLWLSCSSALPQLCSSRAWHLGLFHLRETIKAAHGAARPRTGSRAGATEASSCLWAWFFISTDLSLE